MTEGCLADLEECAGVRDWRLSFSLTSSSGLTRGTTATERLCRWQSAARAFSASGMDPCDGHRDDGEEVIAARAISLIRDGDFF